MLRRIAVVALLAVSAAASSLAAGEPQFRGGPGLGSLESGATGLYELGTVHFGNESGQLQALVHHGRVLQVHCRHDGRWLAKRSGSSGGKTVAPTKFDELATIAGGLNVDMRQAPEAVHERFARAAGLISLGQPATRRLSFISSAYASDCGPIGCRAIYRHDTAGPEGFVISSDTENGRWGFEGYGIVAIWPVPQAE